MIADGCHLKAEDPLARAFRATHWHPAVNWNEYALEGRSEGRIRTDISPVDGRTLYQLSYPGDEAPRR